MAADYKQGCGAGASLAAQGNPRLLPKLLTKHLEESIYLKQLKAA